MFYLVGELQVKRVNAKKQGTNRIRMQDVKDKLSKLKERKTEKALVSKKTIHRKPDYHLLERSTPVSGFVF